MLAPERHEAILRILRERGRVHSTELSQELGVSEDTVRRDLARLASEGQLVRTHGGAVPRSTTKLEFQARSQEKLTEKAHLGRAAAPLIRGGQVVYFDAGSTVLAAARALPPDLAFTAVTHSIPAALALADFPRVDVILVGGRLLGRSLATVGVEAADACRRIHADLCLVGVAALDPESGITEPSYDESLVKRALIESASKVVVIATAAKLGSASPFLVAPASALDVLITEASAPKALLEAFRAQGIEVIAGDAASAG